jgi:type IV fimbrial biogenesis protein FimT
MGKQRGFTLIELLTVVVIAAILMAAAVPSFVTFIRKTYVTSGVNTFIADLRFARSEAIRLGGGVILCRSDAPEASSPACGSGSGPNGNGWVSGWVVFQDLNNNGAINSGEPVLRVQSPIASLNSIVEGGGSSSTKFKFTATGRLLNVSSATHLQFGGNPEFSNDLQRVVCVSIGGRARIAGDGTAACGSHGE